MERFRPPTPRLVALMCRRRLRGIACKRLSNEHEGRRSDLRRSCDSRPLPVLPNRMASQMPDHLPWSS